MEIDILELGQNDLPTSDYIINDLDELPDFTKFVLYCGGKKVGSTGNFVAITGKPKTRKTAFAHAILSSAIGGGERLGFGVRLPQGKPDIILIDTEQDKNDILNSLQRLKKQAGLNDFKKSKQFKVYSVNTMQPEDIIKFIGKLLSENKKIGFVCIDGLLDLINDMNDIKESRNLLHQLKMWAVNYETFFLTILHQSKSSGFSIGHLGSFCDRKAQAILSVEKNKDETTSTCSAAMLRSDANFNDITIQFNRVNQCYEQVI